MGDGMKVLGRFFSVCAVLCIALTMLVATGCRARQRCCPQRGLAPSPAPTPSPSPAPDERQRPGHALPVAPASGGVGGKLRFIGFSIQNNDPTWQINSVTYKAKNEWMAINGPTHATADGYQMQLEAPASGIGQLTPGANGLEMIPPGVKIRPTYFCLTVTWSDGTNEDIQYYYIDIDHSPSRLDFLQTFTLGLKRDQDPELQDALPSGVKAGYRNESGPPASPNNDWAKWLDPSTIYGGWGIGPCP